MSARSLVEDANTIARQHPSKVQDAGSNPAVRDPEANLIFDHSFVGPGKPFNEQDFEKSKTEIQRIMEPLEPAARHRVANKLYAQYETERQRLDIKIADATRRVEALDELKAWYSANPTPTLERNDCSRVHKLLEASLAGFVIGGGGTEDFAPAGDLPNVRDAHVFVVKHDWARAFAHSDGLEKEIKLPYPQCAFEFRVSGRSAIALFRETEETGFGWILFVECGPFWYSYPKGELDKLQELIFAEVLAICVALDAEVATHSVVRAPHKLNQKREQAGKPKLVDYHVVDLARRHRVSNPSAGQSGRHVRLHFRRGHWRHFETTKTWVRWCLVGDPDLGFIQKSYTL